MRGDGPGDSRSKMEPLPIILQCVLVWCYVLVQLIYIYIVHEH